MHVGTGRVASSSGHKATRLPLHSPCSRQSRPDTELIPWPAPGRDRPCLLQGSPETRPLQMGRAGWRHGRTGSSGSLQGPAPSQQTPRRGQFLATRGGPRPVPGLRIPARGARDGRGAVSARPLAPQPTPCSTGRGWERVGSPPAGPAACCDSQALALRRPFTGGDTGPQPR